MLENKSVKIVNGTIVSVILLILVVTLSLMSEDKQKNEINIVINHTDNYYPYIQVNNLKLQFTKLYNQTTANEITNEKIYPISGSWNLKKGEFAQESYGDAKVLMGNSNWTDIIIEGKFNFLKEITGGIGILWRAEDGNTFDTMYQAIHSTYIYVKPESEDSILLIESGFSPNVNRWHKFKIVIYSNNITINIESEKITIINDSRINRLKGKIGLRTYSQKASFKDISVKSITNQILNLTVSYSFNASGFTNLSLNQYLLEKQSNPTGTPSYTSIFTFPNINYTSNIVSSPMNDTLNLSLPADIIRPPDIIYLPIEPYNHTFAIRLVAKGWDEEKHEWVFKEFMSPEFTWEDVVEGRTIGNSENKTE